MKGAVSTRKLEDFGVISVAKADEVIEQPVAGFRPSTASPTVLTPNRLVMEPPCFNPDILGYENFVDVDRPPEECVMVDCKSSIKIEVARLSHTISYTPFELSTQASVYSDCTRATKDVICDPPANFKLIKETKMNFTDKLLLRPSEAAELLSVSRSKIYELISSGRIPSVKLEADHLLRIPMAGLKELIQKAEEQRKSEKVD
jgi:excisionase family DNA binding protein